jgi:tyrocidine synthetase-3
MRTDIKKPDMNNVEDVCALTPLQEGMLFHYLKEPAGRQYVEQLSLELSGGIYERAFSEVWNAVIGENEMLRTVFRWQGVRQPVQMVLKRQKFKPRYYDLTHPLPPSTSVEEIARRDRQERFDLREVPFRVTLVKVAADRHVMIISHHHILYDGWSTGIILREFFTAYHGLCRGENFCLSPKTRFGEFVRFVRHHNRDREQAQQRFWQDYLGDFEGCRGLPLKPPQHCGGQPEPPQDERRRLMIPAPLEVRLAEWARHLQVTLAAVFYTAWGLLLQKYNDDDDVLLGTTLSGRTVPVRGIEDMVGLFINTLPLRVRTRDLESVEELLLRVHHDLRAREAHTTTPLAKIPGYLGLPPEPGLFATLMVVENYPLDAALGSGRYGLSARQYSAAALTHYDLTVAVTLGDPIEVIFSSAGSPFAGEAGQQLIRHFTTLLAAMADHPAWPVRDLEWLSRQEKERLLSEFNCGPGQHLPAETVHHWFARQVEKTADRVALTAAHPNIIEWIQLAYGELDRRAHRLARQLTEQGVGTDTVVGLMVEPSVQMAAAILGILKAGAAYLPLDPAYPQARRRFMRSDSLARIVLTAEAIEGGWDDARHSPPLHLHPPPSAAALCYVIYTSGTTGRPKGVAVNHGGLVNYIQWRLTAYEYGPQDVTLQLLSYSFDGFAANFYSPLLSGGRLMLVPESRRLDIGFLRQTLVGQGVTNMSLVPGLYDPLVREAGAAELKSLRFVVLAGERAEPGLITLSRRKSPRLRHMVEYGPTEATVTAAAHLDIDAANSAVIGRPIAHTRTFILDRFLQPLPVGVPGELCIAGLGLARGYLNNPESTSEKFINVAAKLREGTPSSNHQILTPKSYILYRTGDLCRFLPDGSLEFLGRLDHQVKIRGHRIEPAEIESQLLNHPSVREAVVLSRQDTAGDNYLTAYIVPHPPTPIIKTSPTSRTSRTNQTNRTSPLIFRQYLSRTLPPYMIPSHFVVLSRLPLTPGGKIDRQALPMPQRETGKTPIPPANEVEEKLLTIWSEILSREPGRIGVESNFFERGGHSLKAMTLISRVQREYALPVSLAEFFNMPTIRQLAVHIREQGSRAAGEEGRIEPAEKMDYYPLSSAQQRLYTLQQRDDIGTAYNMTTVLQVEGRLDRHRLERAFRRLIHRHESLRTSFGLVLGEPVQRVWPEVAFQIESAALKEFVRPFDLSTPPLWRVGLIRSTGNRYMLIVDVHHIVADGLSVGILIRELLALYRGETPSALRLQYRDYVPFQKRWAEQEQERLARQQAYWQEIFSDDIPVLELPTDFPRPAVQGFAGNSLSFELEPPQQEGLQAYAAASGTTLYMTVLALYLVFLTKVCNQPEFLVGTPTAGRRHHDVEGIVGMFVNTVVLRHDVWVTQSFGEFLAGVVHTAATAFANQDVQYETLVELSGVRWDLSRNPLFDTMLVLQEVELSHLNIPGLRLRPLPLEDRTAKFDLLLHCLTAEERVRFKFEYSTKLFKAATIRRFVGYFRRLVAAILTDDSQQLQAIDILSERERRQLLFDWNDTTAPGPPTVTIHRLFARQAAKRPDRTALVGASGSPAHHHHHYALHLSYRHLDERAGGLARLLQSKGVGPDSIVAIMTTRTPEMMTGILGILKSGGAYLPIDPGYPQERIDYMLADSRAQLVLTDREARFCDSVDIRESEPGPDHGSTPSSLAYVIYTSGTTGRPRGVLIRHDNVVRLLFNNKSPFDFDCHDVWTLFHSNCFDFSVWEMYGALLYGGKLVIIPRMVSRDPGRFWQVVRQQQVTVLNQTPSAFYNLIDEALGQAVQKIHLRYVIFGGEALMPFRLKGWAARYPGVKLINMFGITETTVHVTYKQIGRQEIEGNISNIGRPIPAWTAYILDQHLEPVPLRVRGELCVGGAGVARGYLNRPELTADRFINLAAKGREGPRSSIHQIPNPKHEIPTPKSQILYRSGDLARRFVDGDMEYLGRIDHQVKIRGHRIEPAEIESLLLQHQAVKEVLVTLNRDKDGDKYLTAYIVPHPPTPIGNTLPTGPTSGTNRTSRTSRTNQTSPLNLRQYLSRTLPDYMIPAHFVPIERIPLTANGKLDRRALPEPAAVSLTAQEQLLPRNEAERQMAAIWARLLGLTEERLSIDESFFHVGGDSIKAIRLIGLINNAFQADVKIRDVYAHQTIEALTGLVVKHRGGYDRDELAEVEQEIGQLKQQVIARLGQRPGEEIEDAYPMSDIERGLIFYYLKNTDTAVYHDQFVYPLQYRAFDGRRFRRAVALLVEKHEILRVGFHVEEFVESVQVVHETVPLDIPCRDLSRLTRREQENTIRGYLTDDTLHRFDPALPPLWRMAVFVLDEANIAVVLVCHHAVLDGWSTASLMTELHNTYMQLASNPSLRLPRLKSSYRDVVVAEMIEKRRTGSRAFWRQELTDYRRLELPRPLSSGERSRGMKTFEYDLGQELLARLKEAAGRLKVSVKDLCFGAYVYMLALLCNENDLVAGCVTHNRPQKEDGDRVLGCFLNTVPVRVHIPSGATWSDYMQMISARMLEIKPYERVSLFEIARIIGEKSRERNPIFDTLFNFVDFFVFLEADAADQRPQDTVAGTFSLRGNQDTNTLFDFEVSITFGQFILCPKYNDQAVGDEMVKRSCRYFERVLKRLIAAPHEKMCKEAVIPAAERRQLLTLFNDTAAEYDRTRRIQDLFEEQVEKTPHRLAVVGQPEGGSLSHLTYRELNGRANRLARAFRAAGLSAGRLAAVVMARSPEMILTVLAILKAGGAYVPLEPLLPTARIRRLLESLNVDYFAVGPKQQPKVEGLGHIFCLSPKPLSAENLENPAPSASAADIAYVIFTSGSTGTPKGVTLCHQPVVNVIRWVNRTFAVGPGDRLLFVSSLGFDLSVYDIFGILAGGAANRVVSDSDLKEPRRLLDIIIREGITFWDSAPAALQQLLPFLSEVKEYSPCHRFRLVFLSGDWIPVTMPDVLRQAFSGLRVVSLGGATEAAIWSNYYPVGRVYPAWSSIPYGKPIQNARYYILDRDLQVCPLMVPGDLYIGGPCLAAGYINDVELTANKFITAPATAASHQPLTPKSQILNPKHEIPTPKSQILYRTGDLARFWPDGNMEFLGRRDQQVKIRGYRIELGEIESQLSRHPTVEDVVVLARTDRGGHKYLCAYVVSPPGDIGSEAELREYLSRDLPEYMIPAHFVKLPQIPLTANGKVDRSALPEPTVAAKSAFAAPQNPLQQQLVTIWAEILKIDQRDIGIDSDFFELGGHSLNAAVVISKIRKTLHVGLPLRELFHRPTIRQLAGAIRHSAPAADKEAQLVEEREYYRLSSAQKRLYILQQMDPGNTVYNLPQAVRLQGEFDRQRLTRAFRQIIRRHDSFRTAFVMVQGEPVQRIQRDIGFEIDDDDGDVEGFIRPFDLSRPPLLRVGLVRGHPSPEGTTVLMLDMHHIAADGTSMGILIREFAAAYQGQELPRLPLRYRDFSGWMNRYRHTPSYKEQQRYWLGQFAGEIPVLNLPTDSPRPELQGFDGAAAAFDLTGEQTHNLNQLARQQGTTLYILLLTIFYVWLHKLSGQQDMVVGTPVEGRRQVDFGGTIGMFVNTLALRNHLAPDQAFDRLLLQVGEHTLSAFENQDYPFEELVDHLEVRRDLGRNPLFDVMLALQNMEIPEARLPGLTFTPFALPQKRAKFDLTLTVVERQARLDLLLEYAVRLFRKETIDRFINCFRRIVETVTGDPTRPIADIEIIDPQEKRKILQDFNDTAADYPRHRRVHQLFADQAARTPLHIALTDSLHHLSYRQLADRARHLALYLEIRGAAADTLIAVKSERSPETIIAIFAILTVGAAYLPIDPLYPEERIRYMLADSGARLVLTAEQLRLVARQYHAAPPLTGVGEAGGVLAYCIYTSGTTGRPKGTLIEHHSLVNRLNWMQRQYPIDNSDTILHKTPFTFDVSVWEIFWWALTGARVYLLVPGGEKDPAEIATAVCRQRVTVMHFVPSMLNLFLDYLEEHRDTVKRSRLRQVFASGEALTASQVKRFNHLWNSQNGSRLANLYGPTEATIDVSYYNCPAHEGTGPIPIGRPIDNIRLTIMDRDHHLQPLGIAGELYIAGVGLARGYLNHPELTSEKFITAPAPAASHQPLTPKSQILNPKHEILTPKSQPLYRTGDLCRFQPDGNIEFLGRIDHQVKIRGFRIELAEIEARLTSHPEVKEAVVLAQQNQEGPEKILAAYIVPAPTSRTNQTSPAKLRQYLAEILPAYMIPAHFQYIGRIPLTPNGKLDRRALPPLTADRDSGQPHVLPQSDSQKRIAALWRQVLPRAEVGIHDNFFDLGGTSLDVIRVNQRMAKEFSQEIPVMAMYKYTTVAALARLLEQGGGDSHDPAGPAGEARRIERRTRGRSDQAQIRERRSRHR